MQECDKKKKKIQQLMGLIYKQTFLFIVFIKCNSNIT